MPVRPTDLARLPLNIAQRGNFSLLAIDQSNLFNFAITRVPLADVFQASPDNDLLVSYLEANQARDGVRRLDYRLLSNLPTIPTFASFLTQLKAVSGPNALPLSAINFSGINIALITAAINAYYENQNNRGSSTLSYNSLRDRPQPGFGLRSITRSGVVDWDVQPADGTILVGVRGISVAPRSIGRTQLDPSLTWNLNQIQADPALRGFIAGFDAGTGRLAATSLPTTAARFLTGLNKNVQDEMNRLANEILGLQRGVQDKEPVRTILTEPFSLGSRSIIAGSSVNGVPVRAGDRILLVGQTDVSENGIYIVPPDRAPHLLTRSTDADTLEKLEDALVFVSEGTENSHTSWICTIEIEPGQTLDSAENPPPITWVQRFNIGSSLFQNYLPITGGTLRGTLILPGDTILQAGPNNLLNYYDDTNQYHAIHRKFVVDAIRENTAQSVTILPDAQSLAEEDYIPVIHPIDGFRPHISDELSISDVAFQGQGITRGDALSLGTLSDGHAWYILGSPNIINANVKADAMTMTAPVGREGTTGDLDLNEFNSADNQQRGVTAIDSNSQGQKVSILMSPTARKVIVVTPVNDLTLALHFTRSAIPPVSKTYVNNLVTLKSRVPYTYKDDSDNDINVATNEYHTFGGYEFPLTLEQTINIFMGLSILNNAISGTWNGVSNLYITSLLSLEGGKFKRRLSLNLARVRYERIELAQANRKLPVPALNQQIKKIIAPDVEVLRLEDEKIQNRLNNLIEEPIATIIGTSVVWNSAESLPAVGTDFFINVLAHGVHRIEGATATVTMNGLSLTVVGRLTLINGLIQITVNVPAGAGRDTDANRGSLIRSISQRHRVEIQVTLSWNESGNPMVLRIPLFYIPLALLNSTIFQRSWNHETGPSTTAIIWNQNPPPRGGPGSNTTIELRNQAGDTVREDIPTRLGFTGLVVGRTYRLWGNCEFRSTSDASGAAPLTVDFRINTRNHLIAVVVVANNDAWTVNNRAIDEIFIAQSTTLTLMVVNFDKVRRMRSNLYLREILPTTITEQLSAP